jgi:FixJ family two-component response regulator
MGKKSILLVDDEGSILEALGWALEKNNFEVTTAVNGGDAVDALQKRSYDLVITDLLMEKVDGIGVLKQAKSLYPEIGVIIMTGYGDVDSAVETLKLGADDYLQKPCDIDELLDKVNQSFERQESFVKLRERFGAHKNDPASLNAMKFKMQESRNNLEQQIASMTVDLAHTIEELESVLQTLLSREEEITEKNSELSNLNATLNTFLKRRGEEHEQIRDKIALETKKMVLPLLEKAKKKSSGSVKDYLEAVHSNLLEVFAKHARSSVIATANLAPRELQVIHYLRQDKSSKEIAALLGLSVRTIEYYRAKIRKKLRIQKQKKNLKKFLMSLP